MAVVFVFWFEADRLRSPAHVPPSQVLQVLFIITLGGAFCVRPSIADTKIMSDSSPPRAKQNQSPSSLCEANN